MVVYQNLTDGRRWCRPLTEFRQEISPGVRRFAPHHVPWYVHAFAVRFTNETIATRHGD